MGIVENLAGDPLNDHQRTHCFLKLRDGGLGLTSAEDTAPLGFLASWALVLPEVGAAVGAVSWTAFADRCVSVHEQIRFAEGDMAQRGDGKLVAHDWVLSGLLHLQVWPARHVGTRVEKLAQGDSSASASPGRTS